MNILFLAAAAPPLTPLRPLGDLAGALPPALAALGHTVRVALPFGGRPDPAQFDPQPVARLTVPHVSGGLTARVSAVSHGGVTYYLIAGPPVTRRQSAPAADGAQFVFCALAALGLCRALDWTPAVIHGLDGRTGAALYWLDTDGLHDPQFQLTASVFNVPDLAGPAPSMARTLLDYGLSPSDSPLLPDEARASLPGLGLAHADMLCAPSPTSTDALPLARVLQARSDRLAVLAPGLDLDTWNPRRDPHLAARYDAASLDGRARCKRALQKTLGLPPQAHTPLIGLTAGPGLGLAIDALARLLAGPTAAQVVLLAAHPSDLSAVKPLARALPGQVAVAAGPKAGLDAALVSRFLAGLDLLLVPDRADAASALLGLRYGAVPVTGGGPVIDYAEARRGTGFVFTDYNAESMLAALQQALHMYARPVRWRALQRRGMRQAQTFAWGRAAANTLALYQQAINYRKEAVTTLTHRLAGDRAADGPDGAGSGLAGAGLATLP